MTEALCKKPTECYWVLSRHFIAPTYSDREVMKVNWVDTGQWLCNVWLGVRGPAEEWGSPPLSPPSRAVCCRYRVWRTSSTCTSRCCWRWWRRWSVSPSGCWCWPWQARGGTSYGGCWGGRCSSRSWRRSVPPARSGRHIVTLSHYHTVTYSHSHTVKLSHCQTVTYSHCHIFTPSHCHTVTLLHSHIVKLSHSHSVTLTECPAGRWQCPRPGGEERGEVWCPDSVGLCLRPGRQQVHQDLAARPDDWPVPDVPGGQGGHGGGGGPGDCPHKTLHQLHGSGRGEKWPVTDSIEIQYLYLSYRKVLITNFIQKFLFSFIFHISFIPLFISIITINFINTSLTLLTITSLHSCFSLSSCSLRLTKLSLMDFPMTPPRSTSCERATERAKSSSPIN